MTQIVYTTGQTVLGQSKWRINANGSLGTLLLQKAPTTGALIGLIAFDDIGGREDHIEAGWDDAEGKITFTRFLPGGAQQVFTGLLGNNHPEQLLLAGSFTESDIPAGAPRTSFAWFATSPTLIS
jgi:hypothetical protein